MQELPEQTFKVVKAVIYQVYFDEATKKACDPAWIPYDNSKKLNEFFENQIIADLIGKGEHLKDEYFGVFSHDVMDSVNFKEEGLHFNPKNLETIISKHKADVFSFQKRRQQTNISTQADRYHPGFNAIMKKVLDHCGLELPHKLDKIILFNLMVCKGEFWEAYFNDILRPAMEILTNTPEAYEDSKYSLIGRKDLNDGRGDRFEKGFGKRHYPYHPFICERLASIYLQLNPQWSFKQIF